MPLSIKILCIVFGLGTFFRMDLWVHKDKVNSILESIFSPKVKILSALCVLILSTDNWTVRRKVLGEHNVIMEGELFP